MKPVKKKISVSKVAWNHDQQRFGGNREVTIQRDREKCVRCGLTREEHRRRYKRDITVDHIDRMGSGVPKYMQNNKLSNLQTLCALCHGRKDGFQGKLTEEQVNDIRLHIREGVTQKQIGEWYGVTQNTVWHIANDSTWRGVTYEEWAGHTPIKYETIDIRTFWKKDDDGSVSMYWQPEWKSSHFYKYKTKYKEIPEVKDLPKTLLEEREEV